MARGAIVRDGVVAEVLEAASDLDLNYGGQGVAFVPDDEAQVGDLWDGKTFTYNWSPETVTPLQARLALNVAGLRDAVDAAVHAAGQTVRDHWEYAVVIHRDNPILAMVAGQLALTDKQLDDLFRAAAKL